MHFSNRKQDREPDVHREARRVRLGRLQGRPRGAPQGHVGTGPPATGLQPI